MKAEIREDGTLIVTAESGIEAYALRKLAEDGHGLPWGQWFIIDYSLSATITGRGEDKI